jgi:uncharacterized protein (DUF3084 family)
MESSETSNETQQTFSLIQFAKKWLVRARALRVRPRQIAIGLAGVVLLTALSILTWSVVELRDDVDSLQRRVRSLSSEIDSVQNQVELDWSIVNSELTRLEQRLSQVESDSSELASDVGGHQGALLELDRKFQYLRTCVDSIADWVIYRDSYYIYC